MITLPACLQRGGLYTLLRSPGLHRALRRVGCGLAGFLLSAASLNHHSLPLGLGLCCALEGSRAALAAAGCCGGQLVFWGMAGRGDALGCLLGLLLTVALGYTEHRRPWLLRLGSGVCCALGCLVTPGLPLWLFGAKVALAVAATWVFGLSLGRTEPVADWLSGGLGVLALAQVLPGGLSLGFPAAAALTVAGPFPLAALSGAALELSGVTELPMTAVLSLAWLVHLLPGRKAAVASAPAVVAAVLGPAVGSFGLWALPGLLVGGFLGLLLRPGGHTQPRGKVGVAQVRLELAANVLLRLQTLLLEAQPPAPDRRALLERACQRACGGCSARKSCGGAPVEQLSPALLEEALGGFAFSCRKPGRLQGELNLAGQELRRLQAAQSRLREQRGAVVQQYRFLGSFLQQVADGLTAAAPGVQRWRPEVAFCANRPRQENGDRCLSFAGVGLRHFVLLCDGMGTGPGAVEEGSRAAAVLRELLCAGFPPEHALQTLNSLCALRGQAGAATVDLCMLELDTGRATVYKWGAAPSWLLHSRGCEKIGTVTPPPGLWVDKSPEAQQLSLRKNELLVMLSDGIQAPAALGETATLPTCPPGELAARLLKGGAAPGCDDATVAVIRLVCVESEYHKKAAKSVETQYVVKNYGS